MKMINEFRSFSVLCMACLLAVVGPAASALDIVKDGKACATVVVADNAGPYPKWAAQWLQEYVQKATGARLEITPESNAPAGTVISVGHTKMAEKAGIKTDDLKYDGCKLLVKGETLYLIGRDDKPIWDKYPSPRESAAQGSIRAVTTFLEDIVGVRWYLPGPEGAVVPTAKNIAAPDNFSKTFIPIIAYGSAGYDTPIANYANNSRSTIKQILDAHTWATIVPPGKWPGGKGKEYFKDHPEYYRMDENGKRVAGADDNCMLCTSNPDVRKIFVKEMSALFDQGYDVVGLGQSDGWAACLCPECKKLRGGRMPDKWSVEEPVEELWDMNKWIIDELGKKYPDKKVMVLIYSATAYPSKRFASLPDNVIGEIAPITPERIDAWRGKIKHISTFQTYWWEEGCNPTCFLPPHSPEAMQKIMRQYRDLGVMGFMGGPRVCWGLGGPLFYAYAKLLGDPDLNMEKLLSEYYQGVYGEAGNIMERFFKVLHNRSGQTWNIARFPGAYPEEDAFSTVYPPAIVAQMDRLLKKAEGTAVSERAKQRVKHTRDCFDGLKTIAEMFAAKRAFDMQPNREMLLLVKDRVERFEQWRARILGYFPNKEYTDKWFPAYEALCGALISEGNIGKYDPYYYSPALVRKDLAEIVAGKKSVRGMGIGSSLAHNEITEPITWNFERMLANIGRPQEDKKMIVRYLPAKPSAAGRIDPKEWESAPAVALTPYLAPNSSPIPNTETAVRLLYDCDNLYVRYECKEPAPDKLSVKPVDRDGNVYGQDEVELFLNPESSSRKVMHFMAAPVKEAMYDGRTGYITDPLDPNSGSEETKWNPEWTYTFAVDKSKKLWTLNMVIPFKSLAVPPPKPETAWLVNFARCRRAGGGEELSSWIPETFGGNPDLFGELVFADESGKVKEPPKPQAGPAAAGSQSITAGVVIDKGNLIANGGFETPDEKGNPKGWILAGYPVNDPDFMKHCVFGADKPHGGKVSLKVDYSDINGYPGSCSQIILTYSLDPEAVKQCQGREVFLSTWLYYEYLDENCQGYYYPGPIIALRVASKDKDIGNEKIPNILLNHASLASFGIAGAAQATGRWCKIRQKGRIPPEAEKVIVRIEQVAGSGAGRNATVLFLDDVCLELAESPPAATKEVIK